MSLGLNNNLKNTKCSKVRSLGLLTSYVVNEIIDKSQDLKRYFVYLTEDPLALRSKDLDGNTIKQPNIEESLINVKGTEILKNGMFKNDVDIKSQTYCFVYDIGGVYHVGVERCNEIYIQIDVIIPDKYDTIIDSDTGIKISRGYAIGIILSDLLDGVRINDDKYSKVLGNLQFFLVSRKPERLAKTNDGVVYSWVYKVWNIDGRR